MPEINVLAIIVAALVPSIMGAIYYGPLFEKQWLDSLGKTKEEMVPSNMAVTYGLALVMALIASLNIKMLIELVHKESGSAAEFVSGSTHTFGHGAFHGFLLCIVLVVPVIVSMSLFQKRSGKNILLNVVFWLICFSIMGGILDVWN